MARFPHAVAKCDPDLLRYVRFLRCESGPFQSSPEARYSGMSPKSSNVLPPTRQTSN
eukprot:m.17623 g.17623  ORF g.17623 m.17623 type:complete len:57 (-) comp5204_c0_seq1:3489-3659(-)